MLAFPIITVFSLILPSFKKHHIIENTSILLTQEFAATHFSLSVPLSDLIRSFSSKVLITDTIVLLKDKVVSLDTSEQTKYMCTINTYKINK